MLAISSFHLTVDIISYVRSALSSFLHDYFFLSILLLQTVFIQPTSPSPSLISWRSKSEQYNEQFQSSNLCLEEYSGDFQAIVVFQLLQSQSKEKWSKELVPRVH